MIAYLVLAKREFLSARLVVRSQLNKGVRRTPSIMSTIELFGFIAVTVMVVAYALEGRGSGYVLLFALSCLAAAGYAAVIRSWPFAVVETVWSLVAFRRWLSRRAHPRGV